ncbi:MAG: hypothetical protein K2H95_07995 [Bacteroidales bacterium]|nr:hypothetical protein [Bacteroidales bacterium]
MKTAVVVAGEVIRVLRPRQGSILWPGNCYDNRVIGCFFGNLKTEAGYLGQFGRV